MWAATWLVALARAGPGTANPQAPSRREEVEEAADAVTAGARPRWGRSSPSARPATGG